MPVQSQIITNYERVFAHTAKSSPPLTTTWMYLYVVCYCRKFNGNVRHACNRGDGKVRSLRVPKTLKCEPRQWGYSWLSWTYTNKSLIEPNRYVRKLQYAWAKCRGGGVQRATDTPQASLEWNRRSEPYSFFPSSDNLCERCRNLTKCEINHYAPRILYIGQTYRYSPQHAFDIFSQ